MALLQKKTESQTILIKKDKNLCHNLIIYQTRVRQYYLLEPVYDLLM